MYKLYNFESFEEENPVMVEVIEEKKEKGAVEQTELIEEVKAEVPEKLEEEKSPKVQDSKKAATEAEKKAAQEIIKKFEVEYSQIKLES
jgi:hypothetical protein